jgi:hypothetical protein
MSARLRPGIDLVTGVVVLGVMLLCGAWIVDRSHRWEQPVWRHRSFIRLRGGARAEALARAPWVVAVNPRCGHCLTALARLRAAGEPLVAPENVVALIVDTPERPGPGALGSIPTTQVWWDAQGIWRHRWGHRLYGEVLQFDGAGRLVRTVQVSDLLQPSRLLGPPGPPASATQ